jgi:putative DNA primase/helicase
MSEVKAIAHGHWRNLLPALGVDAKFLVNRHGPCPICGGDDRFRFDDTGNGGWICNQCGAGDGFSLTAKVTGLPFAHLADKVRNLLGHSNNGGSFAIDLEAIRNKHAQEWAWSHARRPSEGGPVSTYLKNRVGCLWPSKAIREGYVFGKPAMLCKIVDHVGVRAVNLHATILTKTGDKVDSPHSKMVFPGTLPDGCAIRLGPVKPVMGVAEGIETAISAAILYDMPVWACVNGMLLSKWIPPVGAEQITIFGDNDKNYTGQSKAYHLANKLEVQYKIKTKVMIPTNAGEDWNDCLLNKQ